MFYLLFLQAQPEDEGGIPETHISLDGSQYMNEFFAQVCPLFQHYYFIQAIEHLDANMPVKTVIPSRCSNSLKQKKFSIWNGFDSVYVYERS